ncbi:hypothetical protein H1V43_15445 [Streptomyces sp. PSKA54]|uniref:Mce-associated membrane protein n=1 Tax=Streptomyces himalayensis subsp. aureolus TaxID=2758039 RepID=A0A7W2D1J3_9ACTN|nr:hypothetical protein [Streptomyces himalayensis]MBA4862765.1 hypothetical protein [Streptomyces himalayensis subsp. aureolus]
MANPTTRSRTGSPARRSLTAAARAAAKRAERSGHDPVADQPPGSTAQTLAEDASDATPRRPEGQQVGRTLLIEPPDGWDDPPEPRLASEDADEEEPEAPAAARTTRRRRQGLLTAVLAVLLVAGLVAVAVLGWQYRDGRQAEQARGQALAAARKAAPVVLSYDYRRLDRDFAAAREHLTGAFRDQYAKTTRTVVGPTAAKYKGVVKATVVKPAGGGDPAASVVSASPDKAVVLLFVNQVTQSTQVSGSRVDLNRVRMTLIRTSDGWKVSAVDAL